MPNSSKTTRPRGRPIIHGRETKKARALRREVREILRALRAVPADSKLSTRADCALTSVCRVVAVVNS